MLSDRGVVTGKGKPRADVGEWLEDKAPVGEARVGKGENVFVNDGLAKVEDIEIDLCAGHSARRWERVPDAIRFPERRSGDRDGIPCN